MKSENLHLLRNGPVATLQLCNPARHNALGSADVAAFMALLGELADGADVRVLVITNSDGNTFCAGAALDELASGSLTSNGFAALPEAIAALPFATIAAIDGNAFGGGAEIALACDMRIGFATLKIQVPPARIGLCYPLSGIQRFVSAVGATAAKRLLMANETLAGEELLRLGFLTHLVARDAIQDTAQGLATHIAGLAPLAVTAMKTLCNAMAEPAFDRQQALALEAQCNGSRDFREGLAAALAKRQPDFTGR